MKLHNLLFKLCYANGMTNPSENQFIPTFIGYEMPGKKNIELRGPLEAVKYFQLK